MAAERAGCPRRVLMTADTVGGVWPYALELARALAPHGVSVALAAMGGPASPARREEARAIPGLVLFEAPYRLEWMDDPWDDVRRAGEWLLRIADDVRPDLVHLNGYAHAALPWGVPTLVVGHSCVLSWWRAVRGEEAPASWSRYRAEVGRGLAAADLVVAPTRAMLAMLGRHYGPPPRSRVVPNGREPADFVPGRKEPLILSAGRLWDEAKNVAALARVAPRLPWPVVVAGEEAHPDGGAARIHGVRPLGRLAPRDLAVWYARASVYALPARYEPFGLSALEAALAGCALVLGDIPSLREVWGDAALFVGPEDADGLEAALRRVIDDPALRADLAARAGARARAFTPRRMAVGYLNAYRDLMARGAAAGPARAVARCRADRGGSPAHEGDTSCVS